MARKRMIDPGIWDSEDFSRLSVWARLVFIGLFSNADDEGRGRAHPVYLKSILFPYDEELAVADIKTALQEIEAVMSVTFYERQGKQFYMLRHWRQFQTINKPTPSKLPPPKGINLEEEVQGSSDLAAWRRYYEQVIGQVGTLVLKEADAFIASGMSGELVEFALQKAVGYGAGNWAYAKKILRSWQEKGILTVADAKKDDEAFERQKQTKKKFQKSCMSERDYTKEEREEQSRQAFLEMEKYLEE